MEILVLGGTRFFGVPMIFDLLEKGHQITIATRGLTKDTFGNKVKRIILDHTDESSVRQALKDKCYDVVIDKLAYCSNDVKYILDAAPYNGISDFSLNTQKATDLGFSFSNIEDWIYELLDYYQRELK